MELSEPASHGGNNRGLEAGALPGVPFGRFGRMFDQQGDFLDDDCLMEIAKAMIRHDTPKPISESDEIDENPTIPAGYTYFGQFIDHDITLDPTPLNARSVDVEALEDFRSPALDLDNVYGRGPDDQPYMYAGSSGKFALGDAIALPPPGSFSAGAVFTKFDVLRLGVRTASGGAVQLRPAVLGDKRNDENRLVAQIQETLIAFHNKVIDTPSMIARATPQPDDPVFRFRAAVDIVRWHYQWLVVNDYLDKRILKPGVLARVLNPGGTPRLTNYLKTEAKYPYLPVEFSGAAFRLGHSMVRPSYALNEFVGSVVLAAGRVPTFSDADKKGGGVIDPRANLNGFGIEIPDAWGLDWRFFFDGIPDLPDAGSFKVPQPSYRLDANLAEPLEKLPEFFDAADSRQRHLAFRNLKRGVQNLRLASGEQVADALGVSPADRVPADRMWAAGSRFYDPGAAPLPDLEETTAARAAAAAFCRDKGAKLEGNTPLWYYILREAEYFGVERAAEAGAGRSCGGQHLGVVGSEIVAQTLIGLLWLDDNAYINRMPGFQPFPELLDGGQAADFTLGKLFKWVWA